MKINEKTSETFNFHHVVPWETHRAILTINKSKSTSGSIPSKVLRVSANEICIPLTDCINSSISNGQFPTEIKMSDAISVFKEDSHFGKANCRHISLLLSLSKVSEKILHQHLNSFLKRNYPLIFVVSV